VPKVGPSARRERIRETGANGGSTMNELAVRLRDDEKGMTTAEYAVGTVAACSLGGVLIKLLSSERVVDLLWQVFTKAFSFLF